MKELSEDFKDSDIFELDKENDLITIDSVDVLKSVDSSSEIIVLKGILGKRKRENIFDEGKRGKERKLNKVKERKLLHSFPHTYKPNAYKHGKLYCEKCGDEK